MGVFRLPDLGEGLAEAEIVAWLVNDGDHVVTDQPIVSVETDKAVVEVPSPRAGRIARLCAAAGAMVKIGEPLVEFADEPGDDAGTVVGRIERADESAKPEPAEPDERRPSAPRVKATPAIRALARKLNVDLSLVSASGENGAITRSDVERAARMLEEAGPFEPLRGVRRAMAQRMAHAHSDVAPATVIDNADVAPWPAGSDVTIRLVRAIAAACRAAPDLNAWYESQEDGRRLHRKIHLGIAVDTEDGLFVPVLRDIGNRDARSLREGLDRMRADIEARSIPPEELRGATITLSNFGMIGGRYAVPAVVPPQVAILSAGRIEQQVVAVDGTPAVHPLLPLSLTFDHRVVTGGEAARFLQVAIADLERAD